MQRALLLLQKNIIHFCLNIGQEVKTIGREEIEGTALGINSEGCLMIKDSTGKIHDVFTGEVSLRKKDNSYI